MEYRLGDIIEFNPKERLSKGKKYKKISMEMLQPYTKYIENYIEEDYNGGSKFRNGDTLLARITPCLENGKTAQVNELKENEVGFGSTEFIVMRQIREKSDKDFIYYLSISKVFRKIAIKSMTGTSGRQRAQVDVLKDTVMNLPVYKEQVKIAKILSCLDRKIKLNNQINNNLQKLILTIYKQFIEDNSYVEEVLLEDCVEKIGTGADAIQRAPIVDYDTGIRCIRVGDMTNNRKCYEWGFTQMTDKDFNNYRLDIGDIVITRTAVNGIAYLIEDSMKVVCNNGLIRLKVNKDYNPLYIFLIMKTKDFYNYIHRIDSETSVRPNMKVDYLLSYKIKKISLEKQNQFCNMIKPMKQRQKEIEYENSNLIQLRDILLPKLMNGEIDLDKIEI